MPRIRTVKPEFWTDPEILGLSFEARLFFIGLWNFADDYGNIEGHPIKLKSLIFPADPFSSEEITALLEELIDRDLLRPYELENKSFYNIRTFLKHQRINRRSMLLRNPPPPWDQEDSLNTHGGLTEDSLPEGKVREGKVEEGKKSSGEKSSSTRDPDSENENPGSGYEEEKPPPPEKENAANEVWISKAWIEATGKRPNNVQLEKLFAALRSVTREQLGTAIGETGKAAPRVPLNYCLKIVERIRTDEATVSEAQPDNFKAGRLADEEAAQKAEAAWEQVENLPTDEQEKLRARAIRELESDFKPEFILGPLIQARMIDLFQDPLEPDPWD